MNGKYKDTITGEMIDVMIEKYHNAYTLKFLGERRDGPRETNYEYDGETIMTFYMAGQKLERLNGPAFQNFRDLSVTFAVDGKGICTLKSNGEIKREKIFQK